MDASVVIETLARHRAGELSDAALLERVTEWLRTLPGGAEGLRRIWPVGEFPAFNDYLCVDRLGHGASGVVYSAIHLTKPPQMVAVKVLQLVADDQKRRFFEREVEILKALRCPHVARYLDSGTVNSSPYLAMELVRGKPLDRYLAENAPTLPQKLAVFERAARAVAELHDTGVIHRDLTPSHIIIDAAGEAHIVDLGLSAVRTSDWATQVRQTQTRLGRVFGTLKYMSPEQSWGGLIPTDRAADIWALGVMLFEIATDGRYPYNLEPLTGMTPADSLVYRIQNESPARPQIDNAELAPALTTLITRCLVHEPQRRIASAADLADDLARIAEHEHIATKPLSTAYRVQRIAIGLALRARTALWSAIVLGTVGLLIAIVLTCNVHWIATADAYSAETQERLIKVAHPRSTIEMRVVGIGDETMQFVPAWALEEGLDGVTAALTSWRGVHGALMQRLVDARPAMLVWDFYFRSSQPQDPAFVAGVHALDEAHIPVVVGVRDIRPDGSADLSPGITEPLGGALHQGMVVSRNPVMAPGDYILTVGRHDRWYPAMIVSAFGALAYPECQVDIHWPRRQRDVQLRYRLRGTDEYLKALDDIPVSSHETLLIDHDPLKTGDLLAFAGFPIAPAASWEARTISYEDLLRASDDELAERVGGRILVFADVRKPTFWTKYDTHPVRFDDGSMHMVPGGYLIANGIAELLANRRRVSRLPLLAQSLGIMLGMSVVGCLLAVLMGTRLYSGGNPNRRWRMTMPTWAILSLACAVLLTTTNSPVLVQLALAGSALCLALGPALAIEYTRCRRQVPVSRDAIGDAEHARE